MQTAKRSRNAKAKPTAVDRHAPNGGHDCDWTFGEPRADAAGQDSRTAARLAFETIAEARIVERE